MAKGILMPEQPVRPLEPVVKPGRGMHILGFVKPSPQPAALPAPSSASTSARKEPVECNVGSEGQEDGLVRGPTGWKKGKAIYDRGNYGAYYGYRRSGEHDTRLKAIAGHVGEDVFRDKDVLDVGCNTGLVSLAVATDYGAKRVVGMDIDVKLVEQAEDNRSWLIGTGGSSSSKASVEFRAEDILSCSLKRPPSNRPERFDVVLCLSVTKWVHFTQGDVGIRNLFRRCFKRVRSGGLFVLEPQEWYSYKKKRHLTREIRETVSGIELRPEAFPDFLVGLGFRHEATLKPPSDAPKGFQRPLCLFRKPDTSQDGSYEDVKVIRMKTAGDFAPSRPDNAAGVEAPAAALGRTQRKRAASGAEADGEAAASVASAAKRKRMVALAADEEVAPR